MRRRSAPPQWGSTPPMGNPGSTTAIEYYYYTIKINVAYVKTIPSIYGNGKQMKECDNTS